MADQGKHGISWTDATWNPVVGCSIVSPACTNCYAMAQAARIQRMNPVAIEKAIDAGRKPPPPTHYAGTTREVNGNHVWTGKLVLAPDHIVTAPLRWRRPRKVFVNSMSDLFHEDMPDEWIDRVFAVMALAQQHTFQILTKRPERMRAYMTAKARNYVLTLSKAINTNVELIAAADRPGRPSVHWPLPNVWLGVTAEDRTRADERIPSLLATPAAVRFVSAEPLLGVLDLQRFMERCHASRDGECFAASCPQLRDGEPRRSGRHCPIDTWGIDADDISPLLDWVIVGGESGPGARPTHPDWVRLIRDQCAAAGVAFHFKQWGEWAPDFEASYQGGADFDGDDPEQSRFQTCVWDDERKAWQRTNGTWDDHEQWPIASSYWEPEQSMTRLGKRRAGRTLEGVIHDAFPEGVSHG
ncbi:DUF5131 family protein [Phreatobacter sp.]|uniref:DUF5131 family protein n=1 Tax=Phreatobacter sp. TaxID=1966341 RepID=UPI003F70AB7D